MQSGYHARGNESESYLMSPPFRRSSGNSKPSPVVGYEQLDEPFVVSPGMVVTVVFCPLSNRIAERCVPVSTVLRRRDLLVVSRSEVVMPRVDRTMIIVGTMP